jgi:hypothetical protein
MINSNPLPNTWYVSDNAVMEEADVYENLIFQRNDQYVFQRQYNL